MNTRTGFPNQKSATTGISYRRPALLFNAHLETIIPSLFRKVIIQPPLEYELTLPDGDFIEYDQYTVHGDQQAPSRHLCVLCHGLEGNSRRPYMLGMARAVLEAGIDVIAWNYRGCGTKMNMLPRFYHCGATEDLGAVIEHTRGSYDTVHLIGFSLGGNLILKYLGEDPERSKRITSAFTVSVPANMHSACKRLDKAENLVYTRTFISSMIRKFREKSERLPELRRFRLDGIRSVLEFDDRITAPLHGYDNAAAYYHANSAIRFMNNICRPTTILNAANDPFFAEDSSPAAQFSEHRHIRFMVTRHGGHVGFSGNEVKGRYFSEQLAVDHLLRSIS